MKTIAQLNILSNESKQPSFFTGTDSNSFFLTNTTFNRRWLFYFSYLLSPFYSQVHEGKAFSLSFEQSFTAQYQYIEFVCAKNLLNIYIQTKRCKGKKNNMNGPNIASVQTYKNAYVLMYHTHLSDDVFKNWVLKKSTKWQMNLVKESTLGFNVAWIEIFVLAGKTIWIAN